MKTYNNCKPPPPHPPPHKKITRLFLILNASCARYYLCFKFLEMNLHIEREIGYFFVSSFNSINKVGLYSAIIFLHCSFQFQSYDCMSHCSRWCAIILTVITWPSACHSPALGSSSTLWLLVGTIRNVRGPMMQSPITPVCWKMSSLLSTASQVPSHYRVNR